MGLSRDVERAALSGIVWPLDGDTAEQIFYHIYVNISKTG